MLVMASDRTDIFGCVGIANFGLEMYGKVEPLIIALLTMFALRRHSVKPLQHMGL
jgi:hypothetical protein